MKKGRIIILLVTLIIVVTVAYKVYANNSDKIDTILDELELSSSTLLDSNLFTQPDDLRMYEQPEIDMSEYTEVYKNDKMTFYVNMNTFAIRIKYKDYIWSSSLVKDFNDFSRTWQRKLNSPFSYAYFNQNNTDITRSMLDSEENLVLNMIQEDNILYFTVDMKDVQLRVSYQITINEDGFSLYLPHEGLEEYGKNRFFKISFFEFFGSAKLDEVPGYFFIPSGNGALVRFTAHPQVNTAFVTRFFAQDLYYSTNTSGISFNYPVFGTVHGVNQNAYLFNVTSGAEYAEYNYLPSKFRTDYHMQYVNFYLRERYQQKVPSGESVTVIENKIKPYDISFEVTFLADEDANYVGMAKAYKNYLIHEGILQKRYGDEELTLHLDVLGGDYEKGLFFKKYITMTTVDDIMTINEELTSQGVKNIFYTLRGFNKGGNVAASYKNYSFNRKLGNIDKLKELNIAFYYDPTVMHRDSSNAPVGTLKTIDNRFSYEQLENREYYRFYMDIDRIIKEVPDAKKYFSKYGALALAGLSNLFYSNKNHMRVEMYDIYQNLFDEPIAMYNPNVIMLEDTAKFLTIPFQHERLRFFTDNVPFLQIVLSGYIPYYSNYLNFSANIHMDVLRSIDFGSQPAYLITYQPSHLLSNTFSNDYYASYYGNLDENIVETYQFIYNALEKVLGEEIIYREVLAKGIVRVTYSNDVKIIINYTNTDYEYEGEIVSAGNYLVKV